MWWLTTLAWAIPGDIDDDGVPDVDELDTDTDGDGLPNLEDSDDDGDTIPTLDEDPNGNGLPLDDDSDGDGLPNYVDPDDDNDGVETRYEVPVGANPLNADTDGDSVNDAVEWGCPLGTADPLTCELSDDGLIQYGPVLPRNTDSDGAGGVLCESISTPGQSADPSNPDDWVVISGHGDDLPDVLDPDDDNDGIPTGPGGEEGTALDTDLDGLPDYRDIDADGDTRADACEATADEDDDGIPNWVDSDDFDGGGADPDHDRLTTALELLLGLDPIRPDSDGDGVLDCVEIIETDLCSGFAVNDPTALGTPRDSDGDGIIDALDPDDDNDGVDAFGPVEAFQQFTSSGALADSRFCLPPFQEDRPTAVWDADSARHVFRCPDGLEIPIEPNEIDTDGDGVPNRLDPDDDNDGVPTRDEDRNADGLFDDDSDGDDVVDYIDPDDNDGPTADTDGDRIPDSIEEELGLDPYNPDTDGDGILDAVELGNANNPVDTDGDGLIDARDVDDDNDGIPTRIEGSWDRDGDGLGNHHDLDSDNDGIEDAEEGAEADTDGDGIPDYLDDRIGSSSETSERGCRCTTAPAPQAWFQLWVRRPSARR